jgi:sigma-B regulation protein RsbU (phosphoserine phosphatase)
LLLFDDNVAAERVRELLREYRCRLELRPLNCHELAPSGEIVDLVLVVGPFDKPDTDAIFERIYNDVGQPGSFVPLVILDDAADDNTRRRRFEIGFDAQLPARPSREELVIQLEALLRIRSKCEEHRATTTALRRENRRLRLFSEQVDQELTLAGKLQQSFLPRSLPNLGPVRFAVRYEPSSAVGGDFYDLLRLDEKTVGGYVADAMGHGVPAGLLTVYVKKGVIVKEIHSTGYRLLEPNEVLGNLNADLLAQELSENPFITMAYFTLDVEQLRLRCSRAGHPYPMLIRADGTIEPIRPDGLMLGVAETQFEVRDQVLRPGDRVLFYTDGIDGGRYESYREGFVSLQACLADHQHLSIDSLLDTICRAMFPEDRRDDDLTLLALEISR